MKKLNVLWVLLFCSSLLYAQDIVMKQSNEFDSPGGHEIQAPIQLGDKGIFQFNIKTGRGRSESIHVVHFNNKLEKLKENTCKIDDNWLMISDYPHVIRVGEKIYLLKRDVNKEEKTEGMSGVAFDTESLSFSKNPTKLFESSDAVDSYNFFWFGRNQTEEYLVSENESKLGLIYRLKPKNRRDKISYDVIGMNVFNADLGKIWTKEYTMPYTEAEMDNECYAVTNSGKMILLAKVRHEGKREKGQPNFDYELLFFDGQKESPEIIKIDIDKIIPRSINLFESSNGDMMLSGFYSRFGQSSTDGAYVLQIDEKNKKVDLKNGGLFEIPTDLIKANASAKELRQMKREERKDDDNDLGVGDLTMRFLIRDKSGDLLLLGEEYDVQSRTITTGSGASTYTRTEYKTFAKDIYIIRANKDGSSWVKKIPKNQRSNDAYGAELSFNNMLVNDNLYVFYTDNKKNKNLASDDVPSAHVQGLGGYLACVKLDKDGAMSKQYLGEIDDFETNFFIRRFVQGDHGNIIYTARRHRRNTVISLEAAN